MTESHLIPQSAVDEVEARIEAGAREVRAADEMDAVLAADAALRDLDAEYRAPQEPLALEEIADDLEDAIPSDLAAPYARAAAIYLVARLYGLRVAAGPLTEEALDALADTLGEVEGIAPCGCVAFRDGTGDPCAEHHPDARAAATRKILVHLNVEVPADDARTPDEIAAALLGALEVGQDDESVRNLTVESALAEAI